METTTRRFNRRRVTINKIVKVGVFAALSSILYYFPAFPLPIFPEFLDIQFSNLPAILAGFVTGPIGGSLVVIIRTIIKLPASHTAYVGELADLIIGLCTVLSSSLIYYKWKSKKGGLVALIVAIFVWTGTAVLCNWLFLIDFYAGFFTGGMNTIVGMCAPVIKGITVDNFMGKYLLFGCLPFNLLLSTVVCLVTFVVYKYISNIFKHDFFAKRNQSKK